MKLVKWIKSPQTNPKLSFPTTFLGLKTIQRYLLKNLQSNPDLNPHLLCVLLKLICVNQSSCNGFDKSQSLKLKLLANLIS